MSLARLLSASIPLKSPADCSRLMLGRKTWFTDWRKICTMGASTVATENEANWVTVKSAAAIHWSAWLRTPCSAPESAKGAAWRTCAAKVSRRATGPRRPWLRAT